MNKTYAEKYKDPRWQKLRLEALNAAGWTCSTCGDTQTTLHVHHRQYFKGRNPWEYQVGQLEVLCESCHEAEHDTEDKLLLVASFVPLHGTSGRASVASLIAGYCGMPMTNELVDDPDAFVLGQLAATLEPRIWFQDLIDLRQAMEGRDRATCVAAIKACIKELGTMPDAIDPARGVNL